MIDEVEHFKKSSTLPYDDFKPLPQKRSKRVLLLSGELASDEIIENPLDNFKINTFFVAYDTSIIQIESRFTEQTSGIFKDISLFSRRRIEEISKDLQTFPIDAFSVFADVYKRYINVEDLRKEYLHFCKCYFGFEKIKYIPTKLHNSNNDEFHEDTLSSLDSDNSNAEIEQPFNELPNNGCSLSVVFNVLRISGLDSTFPTLNVALKIALTLPVTSTTPERTFSKLSIIKINYEAPCVKKG